MMCAGINCYGKYYMMCAGINCYGKYYKMCAGINCYGKYYMLCAGIYLMVVLATSCLSVLSSVLVLSIHHQRGRPRRVPGWLRYVVFRVVARLVCVRTYTYHYRYSASTSSSSSASSRDKRRQQTVARHKERKASVTLKK